MTTIQEALLATRSAIEMLETAINNKIWKDAKHGLDALLEMHEFLSSQKAKISLEMSSPIYDLGISIKNKDAEACKKSLQKLKEIIATYSGGMQTQSNKKPDIFSDEIVYEYAKYLGADIGKCSHCKKTIVLGKYCAWCGKNVFFKVCSKCHRRNDDYSNFCAYCGTDITKVQPREG